MQLRNLLHRGRMSCWAMRWFGVVCLVGVPASALAQTSLTGNSSRAGAVVLTGKLQEIIVTAERRRSTEQKTAESISVRRGAALTRQGKYSLAQILEDVPGVVGGAEPYSGSSFTSGTDSPAAGLTIRGIQSNQAAGGSMTSVAPAAAIYVDGVYDGIGGNYDINRVEVLRGPQGTLYGRSATAGLVAIHTFDPNLKRYGGDVALEFGNYDLKHYTAAVNLPLIRDVLAIRVAGNRYASNGFYSAEGGAMSTDDGRIKILYKPNDDLSVLLGAALENDSTRTGGTTVTLSAPNSYLFTSAPVGLGSNDSRQYWATVRWNFGPATLTYEPAFRSWESSAVNYIRNPIVNVDQTLVTPKDNFITQELHITSNPGSKLSWQVGALYYDNDLSNSNEVAFSPSGFLAFNSITPEKTTRATGVFAQATYRFAPSWRLTGGLRYDYTKITVNENYIEGNPFTGVTFPPLSLSGVTRRFNNVTYKARLEHDLTAQNMIYASISTGFSPGDVSISTTSAGPVALNLKAETLTAYEIGSKNRFVDDTLQVNGAVFYYNYAGYQTDGVDTNLLPNGQQNAADPGFSTLVSPVQSLGGELEVRYIPTAGNRVDFNMAYTDAYYVHKSQTLIPTGLAGPLSYVTFGYFFARDRIPGVVPFTSNLAYEHAVRLPGDSTLTLHGDVRYLSANDGIEVTQPQLAAGAYPFMRVGAQVIGDLSAAWSSGNGRYGVTVYVRNVGNNEYKTFPQRIGAINIPLTASTVMPYDPRTYGVVLTDHF